MSALLEAPHARDAAKGEQLMTALQMFGAFVLNNGLEGVIAAHVLHRHFPLTSDEAVLDFVDVTAQQIATRVVPAAQAAAHQPAVWGFTPDGTPVILGWSDGAQTDEHLRTAIVQAGAFLAQQRLTTVLAIVAYHTPFPIDPDNMLFEQTDETARTQLTTVVPRSTITLDRAATWIFQFDGSRMERGRVTPADVTPIATRGCDPGC